MEQINNTAAMLDYIIQPAFCVKDGKILHVNRAAEAYLLTVGGEILPMISIGQEEYQAFTEGCLYLTLSLCDQSYGFTVSHVDGLELFILEPEADNGQLRAMALAARELREPLANIMTMADKLFPTISNADAPAAQEQIARINRGLYQMLRVIGNMSDAARYTYETAPALEQRDVCGILEEIFSHARELGRLSNIDIRFTAPQEAIYIPVDAQKLERAVYNILSNAMKFTPSGGWIEAKLTNRGSKLYLTVEDSGSGIPASLRGTVYSRYLREPSVEDGRHGIGLGMVLVYAAAAAHGGTVLMEQPENGGTRITMTLSTDNDHSGMLRSNILQVDYAGERSHGLVELSDILPHGAYTASQIN